jgi:hypothetical protein
MDAGDEAGVGHTVVHVLPRAPLILSQTMHKACHFPGLSSPARGSCPLS